MTMRAQLDSELVKTRSLRTLVALPMLALAVAPAVALLVGLTESLQPDDTILGGALTGSALGMAVLGVWGALLMTSEYSSGTIRPVLAATPRRRVVLATKAAVATATGMVIGSIATGTAATIGYALLDTTKYRTGDAVSAVLGVAACYSAMACLGVAVGALLRNSAGAVAVVFVISVLPGIVGPLLGGAGRWVVGAGPSAVAAKLAQSSDATSETMGSLGGGASLLMLTAYTLAACAAATRLFENRDA